MYHLASLHRGNLTCTKLLYRTVTYSSDLSVTIPDLPFQTLLWTQAEKKPNKTALVCGATGRSYTYREAVKGSHGVSNWLLGQGGATGDVVAAVLANCPEYPILFSGVAAAGMALTPINNTYVGREIAQQVSAAGARWIITDDTGKTKISEALQGKNIPDIILTEGSSPNLTELLQYNNQNFPPSNPGPDTVAQLPYSSGTTGLPKGVILTHRNLTSNITQMTHPDMDIFTEDDRVVVVNPLYHVYAMNVTVLNLLTAGGTAITLPEFKPKSFIEALEKFKPTVLQLPPPLIGFLADHPLVEDHHLESLRYVMVAAAPVGEALEERFTKKAPGVQLREGYGMSESSPMTLMTRPGESFPGSAGKLVPSTQARIVDPDSGLDVPTGSTGELLIKGPQVMPGYLNNEKATNETVKDGWLLTGDIAKCDELGNFYLVDRLKELIKVKGLQVAPAELENLIREHPGVLDCAVVGVEDERAGQVPRAVVVKAESSLTAEEVYKHVSMRASRHKHLDGGVVFTESIPRSAAGKILRKDLKALSQ